MTTRIRALVLPILAVLLVALAAWLYWDASSRRSAQAAGAEAVKAARDTVPAMLSYRPETAEKDLSAARERLTGRFLDDYTRSITTVVIPNAQQRKVVAVAKVQAAAVMSAQPNRAVVLAYVDQTITEGTDPPSAIASTARVTMEKVDGRWLLAGFELL